jgi:uncharacterized membrane protein HdeD (DUF308 family)
VEKRGVVTKSAGEPFFLGAMMIERPERMATVLTMILAGLFIVGGSFRVVAAIAGRFAGWPWVLLNGVIATTLGILIWEDLPLAADLVIGMFVGIDLIFYGWSWVMLALIVRAPAQRTPTAEPERQHVGV